MTKVPVSHRRPAPAPRHTAADGKIFVDVCFSLAAAAGSWRRIIAAGSLKMENQTVVFGFYWRIKYILMSCSSKHELCIFMFAAAPV